MNHHPYITLNDGTEITYSEIKEKEDGTKYISVYFETPTEDGFSSMTIDYPEGIPKDIRGYSQEEVSQYMCYFEKDAGMFRRKGIKNPFYKIHMAAIENGGDLPEEKRKEMMKEAISEIRKALQDVKGGNGQ